MKNTINLMIAWAIVCAVFVLSNSAVADTCGIKGDVNGDHKVDLREAIYALQVAVGIQPKQTIDEDEAEPNNIQENSNPISEDAVVTGNIGSGDDEEDWYKIVMPANGLIQYSLENLNEAGTEQGNIGIIALYQQVGLDLIELHTIYIDHGNWNFYIAPGEMPTSQYIAVSGNETYYVKVPKYPDHTAPYELRLSFTLLETTDIGEGNDSSDDAHEIQENGTVEALSGYGSDEDDWYVITPSANGLLQYSVENLHPSTSGIDQGIIGVCRFYQKVGLDLIELHSIYIDHGNWNFYIAPGEMPTSKYIAVSAGSVYYVKVERYEYNSAPYEMKATFIQLETTDIGEGNDSSDDAHEIQENGTVEALSGYGSDEDDWYVITPSANGLLQYSVENLHPSTSGIDQGIIGVCRFYQKVGLDLIELHSIYIDHGNWNFYIAPGEMPTSQYIAVSAGSVYYVKVERYEYNSAPYEMKATFIQLETTDIGEANSSFTDAHTIQENDTVTALIGYGTDEEDWYEISVPANGSFQFEIENLHHSTSGIDQGIIGRTYFYKQDGLELSEVTSIYIDHGNWNFYIAPGESPKSNTIAVSGDSTYYIKVPKYDDYNVAPYTLKTVYLAD